ncbi:MAG TPA: exosortase J [Acidobacteriaceae bacterium]|nr:exosortase J [Acidobacteriaceae bacterium]
MASEVVTDAPTTVQRHGSSVQYAALAATAAVLGVLTIPSTVIALWTMWTTDALKSVGMAVPIVSLVLILRAWKSIGWRSEGSWWGLGLLLAAMAGSWVEGRASLILIVSPEVMRVFPPAALVFLTYGTGMVLLFGGARLLRAALFPVLLLLLVNPVSGAFAQRIDLPLQRISAEIARGMAMHLGQNLTPDKLRLMFTPDFGMFIAPGCNGLRGAVTMGLVALVAGYVYRFRWIATAAVTMGAILLGYLFNLLRLCALVLYYLVALHLPRLQDKAEQADYVIGAALFLIATLLLFSVIHWLRDRSPQPYKAADEEGELQNPVAVSWAKLLAVAMVAIASLPGWPVAIAESRASVPTVTAAAQSFPERIGEYVLQRTWNETLQEGPIIYMWAEYVPAGGGIPVAIGISPVSNWHNPLICRSVRGDDPVWQGQLTLATAESPVQFSAGFYNDGVTQTLDVSTLCSMGKCGEYATERSHMGFLLSFPTLRPGMMANSRRSTRVLLRVEALDPTQSSDGVRNRLDDDLRRFLAGVPLSRLTGEVAE